MRERGVSTVNERASGSRSKSNARAHRADVGVEERVRHHVPLLPPHAHRHLFELIPRALAPKCGLQLRRFERNDLRPTLNFENKDALALFVVLAAEALHEPDAEVVAVRGREEEVAEHDGTG